MMDSQSSSEWISTSNKGSAVYAIEEWRRLFPGAKGKHLQPSEIVHITVPETREAVWAKLLAQEPVFVRHIHPADAVIPVAGFQAEQLGELAAEALSLSERGSIAVQVRLTDKAPSDLDAVKLREALSAKLGIQPVVQHASWIVSLTVTENALYAGVSTPEQNLSDWTGGAIRFRKEAGLISRAQFKLLEAETRFGLRLDSFSHALDIGAAPGGWTSLLLERGVRVTAVDPGELDSRIKGHPALTYHRNNAADVRFQPSEFDLLVCDMSWSPRQMHALVNGLLYALKAGGTAIITIKLMHGKPFQSLKEAREAFADRLEERGAKQLFHNREEFTMCFVKKERQP